MPSLSSATPELARSDTAARVRVRCGRSRDQPVAARPDPHHHDPDPRCAHAGRATAPKRGRPSAHGVVLDSVNVRRPL